VRFEFDYSADLWAVMPLAGSEGEADWVAEQVALARAGDPALAGEAERRAWHALSQRREGIGTSLYFRPPGLPASGVLHITVGDVSVADEEFVADDWIREGIRADVAPTVMEFETDHCPHGFRVAYVAEETGPDGSDLAGITYGLRFPDGVCAVFSEQADRETTALLQIGADPLVSSLRLVA
jgi:hypothetical protein